MITIKLKNDSQLVLNVSKLESIWSLKSRISSLKCIPIDTIKLIYNRKILKDELNLEDNKIPLGSLLFLVTSKSKIQIIVKQLGGKLVTLDVDPSKTINTLKEKIEKRLKIPSENQRLIHNKQILKNEARIQDLGIMNHSIIHVSFTIEVILRVKTSQNQLIVVRLLRDEKVEDLKKKIEKILKIPAEKQIIVSKGRKLDDFISLVNFEQHKLFVFEEMNRQVHFTSANGEIRTIHCDDQVSIRSIIKEIKKINPIDEICKKVLVDGKVINNPSNKLCEINDQKIVCIQILGSPSTCEGDSILNDSLFSR